MKSHFHPKSLLFYGVMISSVLLLFRITSAYGEKHLKAPPDVNGRYVSTQAPPGCPESSRLALTILQSGVYLHGSLQLQETGDATPAQPSASQNRPSLDGRWDQSQIVLTGPTEALAICGSEAGSTREAEPSARSEVSIQGKIEPSSTNSSPEADSATFTGQLTIAGSNQPWTFNAERQAAEAQSVEH